MPRAVVWTPDMDRALRDLYGRMRVSEVARRIGVGVASVYRRLRELGIPLEGPGRWRRRA